MEKELIRIVFFGSGKFAIPTLELLIAEDYDIPLIVTTPDSPVQKFAEEQDIPSFNIGKPEHMLALPFIDILKKTEANLFIVASFKKLPEAVFNMPSLGTFNIHASLLPDYRGAAPVNWAIINGENRTGVTTFFLDKNIDTGHIILQKEMSIQPSHDATSLEYELSLLGAEVTKETIETITKDEYKLIVQNSSDKLAPKLNLDNRELNFSKSCLEIFNQIRGLNENHTGYVIIKRVDNPSYKIKIFVHKAAYTTLTPTVKEGSIVISGNGGPGIVCKDGIMWLNSVQREGRNKMTGKEFYNGLPELRNYVLD